MGSTTRGRGGTVAAALLLGLGGIGQAANGIAAVASGGYVTAPPGYTFEFSIAAWGWVHLAIGVLAIVVAVGLFRGGRLARILAFALAAASLVSNFLWLPIEPGWSVALIALSVFVLWAVTTAGEPLFARSEGGR
ncbi:DUF7144 family membrane protein [Glycomyces paridis]|uniref:DUF7144 domain-containing protein n=1 Tax=Glycomyces paridis TaxID=2126555 RepID=A0A4S8PG39_9ACTN|nr:hypothetical protein [Glycomyces paridis]THV29460.1 hypothetical protein E9998_08060 [Glycomyces paridis]